MKVNEFKKIEEALFSDLMGLIPDAKVSRKVNPKNVEKLYLKDFIEDLYADLDAAIKGNAITTTATGPIGTGFTPERIEKIRPIIDRLKNDGKISNTTQLGSFLAKRYPSIWKNTQNKKQVLDNLLGTTSESYIKLNAIIESIITEQTIESISSWVLRWFEAYMKGIDWSKSKLQVEQLAKQIESTYSKDKAKQAVQQLAALSWDTTFKAKGIPKGAEDVYRPQQKTGSSNIPAEELKALEKLRTKDADRYLELLKQAGIKK